MEHRWSRAVVALHWLSFLLVVMVFVIGHVMHDQPRESALRQTLAGFHSLPGMILLLLTLARLVLRWRQPAPTPLALSSGHARVVRWTHGALYALVLGMCLSGFVQGQMTNWHAYVAGDVDRPPDFRGVIAHEIHELIAPALLVLVVVHIIGVLAQQRKTGDVMRRMWPAGR